MASATERDDFIEFLEDSEAVARNWLGLQVAILLQGYCLKSKSVDNREHGVNRIAEAEAGEPPALQSHPVNLCRGKETILMVSTGKGYRLRIVQAALFVMMCSCFHGLALAQDTGLFVPVILEQEPLPQGVAGSASPLIRIKFQDEKQLLKMESLLFEVDRTDFSALVQFVESTLTFQPQTQLQPGNHEVRITGTTADGRKIQEILWSFTVPQNEIPRSWQFGIEPTGTFEYKIQRVDPNADRERFNGNIGINSSRTGTIQTSFVSNLQAQTPFPGPVPSEFDLANFTASISNAATSFALGDVLVNYDFLGVANLSRRGIFFQQKLPFLASGFDFFSVRSESIIGFRHGLGVSDAEQRIDGGSFFFSPSKSPERLALRLYMLRGENALEQGFNFGGVTRGSKGDAFGLALNSSVWAGQLRAEGFASWSDFDFNASDEFNGNSDHAFVGRLVLDPAPRTWKTLPSKFLVQFELQDLGLFYKSLANPFLVGDRRGINLNGTWTLGTFGFLGGVSKFHDNVKNLELLPTVNNVAYSSGISFTPIGTDKPPNLPSISLTATRSEQVSIGEVVSFLAVKNVVDSLATVLQFTRPVWNVSLNGGYAVNQDQTNRGPDTDAKNIALAAFFTPSPFRSFGPSVSFIRQKNRDTRVDTDLWTYSLTSAFAVKPEKISLDGQISFSTTESSDLLNKGSNLSGTAQVSFQLHQFLKTKGRQAVALRLSYNRLIVDAPFLQRQSGLEIFAVLELGWPLGF